MLNKVDRAMFKMRLCVFFLFGITATNGMGMDVLDVAIELQSITDASSRTWTDSTGRYQVEGCLTGLNGEYVRIFKTNNKYTTVPIRRLSSIDRRYVDVIQQRIADEAANIKHIDVVHVRIGKELFQRIAQRDHRSNYPVNETINGVPLVGSSQTLARTDIRLVANAKQAVLEIPIQGISKSKTASDVRIAQVFGQGTTFFEKIIRVSFDDSDYKILSGRLRTSSSSLMTGITTSFNGLLDALIKRIVTRRAAATKADFDRESERRERARINESIDTRIDNAASLIDEFIDMTVEAIDQVRNKFQVRARTWTSDDHLYLVLAQSEELVTGTLSPPPEVDKKVPFSAQVHRSVIPQAITESELADKLKPVLQDFLSKHGGGLGNFEERILKGRLEPSVSSDGQWIIVFWYPPAKPEEENTATSRSLRQELQYTNLKASLDSQQRSRPE